MTNTNIATLHETAVSLLRQLIAKPSFSKQEHSTADILETFLKENGIAARRHINNVWAVNEQFDASKPTLLLNSHHDTVKPNKDYSNDPFDPFIIDGKLFGLGSNDAGGSLVALIAAFLYYYREPELSYNLIIAAAAEEEISGANGISALLPLLGDINCAIVGEPTLMQLAVAEKGLMVVDCVAHGRSGHAAREEGDNAIYKAMTDIAWFSSYPFSKVSDLTGAVKMSVTMVGAGTQHNVVPAVCNFVADIRINELYSHEEVLETIKQHVQCDVIPRSTRLRATSIAAGHPLVQSGISLGKEMYGSATLSDKALMPFPALKMGPGDSARSHMADEYIFLNEIRDGIDTYIQLLKNIL